MGWYTAQNNERVNKLVLYAPQWIRTTASLVQAGRKIGAYRTVSKGCRQGPMANRRARRQEGFTDSRLAGLRHGPTPPLLPIPVGSKRSPRCCVPPTEWCRTGSITGVRESAGTTRRASACRPSWPRPNGTRDLPSYMAFMPTSPNWLMRPYKRYVEIGEGTHTVIMEKNQYAAIPGCSAIPG